MAILYSQAVGQNISDIYLDLSLRVYGSREEESEGTLALLSGDCVSCTPDF